MSVFNELQLPPVGTSAVRDPEADMGLLGIDFSSVVIADLGGEHNSFPLKPNGLAGNTVPAAAMQ